MTQFDQLVKPPPLQGAISKHAALRAALVRAHAPVAAKRARSVGESELNHQECLAALHSARSAAGHPAQRGSSGKLKFRRAQFWSACPLGCMPGPVEGLGRLPDLWPHQAPAHSAEAAAAASSPHMGRQPSADHSHADVSRVRTGAARGAVTPDVCATPGVGASGSEAAPASHGLEGGTGVDDDAEADLNCAEMGGARADCADDAAVVTAALADVLRFADLLPVPSLSVEHIATHEAAQCSQRKAKLAVVRDGSQLVQANVPDSDLLHGDVGDRARAMRWREWNIAVLAAVAAM